MTKTRVVVHAISSDAEKIVILAKDTEVLLLLIYDFDKMRCKQLWIQMGPKKQLYVPIHEICEKLSTDLKQNILAFHFLTGSNFTSRSYGIGKAAGWKVYEKNAKLLSNLGDKTLTRESINSTEEFVVKLYKVDEDIKTGDSARFFLFRKLKSFADHPPTTDALRFHIYRCHYQTQVFKNCFLSDILCEDPTSGETQGWRLKNRAYTFFFGGYAVIVGRNENLWLSEGSLQ